MNRKRILWVKTDAMLPLDKGGKIRSYNMLTHISRDVDVDYLCYAANDLRADDRKLLNNLFYSFYEVPANHQEQIGWKYIKNLAIAHVTAKPFTLYNYYQRRFENKLNKFVAENTYKAVICDFLAPALNFRPNLRKKAVLFQHNVEHVLWERQSSQETRKFRKLVYNREYHLVRQFEKDLCRNFSKVVCVSKQDADVIRERFALNNVYSIDTGVDIEYFKPQPDKTLSKRLVFTGSMDWLPNIDAMLWFVREILPQIRQTIPDVELAIVGRSPTQEITNMGKTDSKVVVTGKVEDVRPWMAQGAIFVVPIRVGGGTRLKIYEAMAMGLPVISTTIGAEGLTYINNENILIADGEEPFANEVVRLIKDQNRCLQIGAAARNYVVENFSWSKISEQFLSIIFG